MCDTERALPAGNVCTCTTSNWGSLGSVSSSTKAASHTQGEADNIASIINKITFLII